MSKGESSGKLSTISKQTPKMNKFPERILNSTFKKATRNAGSANSSLSGRKDRDADKSQPKPESKASLNQNFINLNQMTANKRLANRDRLVQNLAQTPKNAPAKHLEESKGEKLKESNTTSFNHDSGDMNEQDLTPIDRRVNLSRHKKTIRTLNVSWHSKPVIRRESKPTSNHPSGPSQQMQVIRQFIT